MKVLAESQPPRSVPYIHLGYIAVSTRKFPPGLLESGLLVGLVGALLAFKLKRNPDRPPQSSPDIRLRQTRWGWAGLALVGLGLGLCVLAFAWSKQVPRAGKGLTQITMQNTDFLIEGLFQDIAGQTNAVPFKAGEYDLAEFLKAMEFPEHYWTNRFYTQDAWRQPIKLSLARQQEGWQTIYCSAGEDGKPATSDDVCFTNVHPFQPK